MSFLDGLMYARALRNNPTFGAMERERINAERDRKYFQKDLAAQRDLYNRYYGPGGLMNAPGADATALNRQLGHEAGLTAPLKDVRGVYGTQAFGLVPDPDGGMGDGTAPMKNFAKLEQLVKQYGPNSPEVRAFIEFVRATQWLNTGGAFTAARPQVPTFGTRQPATNPATNPALPPANAQGGLPYVVDPATVPSPFLEPGEELSPESPLGPQGAPRSRDQIPIGLGPEQELGYVGDRASTEQVSKDFAKSMGELAVAGQAARRNLVQLNDLRQTLRRTGSGIGPALQLLAADFGMEIGEGVDDLQAARALISRMVPAQRPPGSGPMSDADLELFKRSLPRIINQPGGNERIIESMVAINEYDAAVGRIATQFQTNQISRAEARAQLDQLANPLDWVRGMDVEDDAPQKRPRRPSFEEWRRMKAAGEL